MKMKRLMMLVCVAALTACVFCVPTYAASGDVAGAIEGTWDTASEQIKTVVNNVVFPAIDLILAVFFFAKLGTAYFVIVSMGSLKGQHPQFCLPALCLL